MTDVIHCQMERIYQMNVVPDMLPELHPSFDLRIRYLAPAPKDNYLRTRVKRKHRQVEPGIFLTPEQVRCGRAHERRHAQNLRYYYRRGGLQKYTRRCSTPTRACTP